MAKWIKRGEKVVERRSERERGVEGMYWYSLERGRAGEYFEV
jgi:hypothetical protein